MTIALGWIVIPALVFNLWAFLAQGWDKRRSMRRGASRVPEATLLLLALPLASPGMLLGMKLFRHKTRKRSFQIKAAVVVFANLLMLAALVWLAIEGHLTVEAKLY
jgi:uncharacterized membrane protein YsdA (DUF1294 family)